MNLSCKVYQISTYALWMNAYFLKLTKTKTEFLVFLPSSQRFSPPYIFFFLIILLFDLLIKFRILEDLLIIIFSLFFLIREQPRKMVICPDSAGHMNHEPT